MNSSERSESIWKVSAAALELSPLSGAMHADVCIVGAGIAGMTAAYMLVREGKSVVVLDKGAIGHGETGQTTAHLASALDDRFYWLERIHGRGGAALAYESHAAAIDRIEQIVQQEGIDCEFERLDGLLFVDEGQSHYKLERELAAALRSGFSGVTRLPKLPLSFFDSGPCLRFPEQAQFHPLRYLEGLYAKLLASGAARFGNAHVIRVEGEKRGVKIRTSQGIVVSAAAAIVATNSPVNDRFAIHTKQAPYRTFAIGLEVPAGSIPRALYWDMADPYHYVRLTRVDDGRGKELLVVGGEDHKTGEYDDAEQRYAKLEMWARRRFPMSENVTFRWSGQVMEPVDGLAFIGRDPEHAENVYIATGDSGHGMTHGTIAGMLLTDLIAGRENPWERLYSPTRRKVGAAIEFLKENVKVAGHYAEWLKGGDVHHVRQILPGRGAVLQRGRHKLAVFRDSDGRLHACSAVCTHLGGIVHWNSEEKSWDCPCHGSRFSPTGEVRSGPATVALSPAEVEIEEDDLQKAS